MAGPRIVLVGTKESANVGAVARAMFNFGLDDLVLVAPRCVIDARAHALATHAAELLERLRVVDTLAEAVEDQRLVFGTSARHRTAENYPVRSPRQAAEALLGQDVAVVFGPEDHGLSNADLNRCQAQVVIPTAAFSSLNLAQAVVVIAYEAFQAKLAAGASMVEAPSSAEAGTRDGLVGHADRAQLEGMYAHLLRTFHLIGFTDASRERSIDRLMRGLFDRVALAPREVAALRGFLSQVAWAAHQPPDTFLPETCQDGTVAAAEAEAVAEEPDRSTSDVTADASSEAER